jgi:uncharacterized protein (TIGR02453 family)
MAARRDAVFGPDLFRFLRDLAAHNDREWFQANKGRYESAVLAPAVRFVAEVGPELGRRSAHVVADARPFGGSVARIYRDTRFSKDKSPYRTNLGIHFAHELAKGAMEPLPGFYLQIEPGGSVVYSGVYHPPPPALKRIRDAIVSDGPAWARVLKASPPDEGESYARVPAGYDADHRYAADLKRKDFYAGVRFKDSQVTSTGFEAAFLAACRRVDPLNRWLADALGVPW